jgi:hypothetical protein
MSEPLGAYSFAIRARPGRLRVPIAWGLAVLLAVLAALQLQAFLHARSSLTAALKGAAASGSAQPPLPSGPSQQAVADALALERHVAARSAPWADRLLRLESTRPGTVRVVRLSLDGSRRTIGLRVELERPRQAIEWLEELADDPALSGLGTGGLKGCERKGEQTALQQCEFELPLR